MHVGLPLSFPLPQIAPTGGGSKTVAAAARCNLVAHLTVSSASDIVRAAALAAVALVTGSARAQQPPGYPGLPPPAPAIYPPPGAPDPARAAFRPFTLGLGLGAGGLVFHDLSGRAREGGLSYTLRIGFGVTRGWLVFLGAEGTGTNHMKYGVWQTAYLLGTQYFIVDRLYLRAGFGLANATAGDASGITLGGTGPAFMAAAGLEIAQGLSTSLALEPSLTAARHGHETWSNFGVNFVLSFY
jgi:hypothetical protein